MWVLVVAECAGDEYYNDNITVIILYTHIYIYIYIIYVYNFLQPKFPVLQYFIVFQNDVPIYMCLLTKYLDRFFFKSESWKHHSTMCYLYALRSLSLSLCIFSQTHSARSVHNLSRKHVYTQRLEKLTRLHRQFFRMYPRMHAHPPCLRRRMLRCSRRRQNWRNTQSQAWKKDQMMRLDIWHRQTTYGVIDSL